MKRTFFTILAGLLLVIIGALLLVDKLLATGVEEGVRFALGVPTTLEGADVGLIAGTLSLHGLVVANPPGFDGPDFCRMRLASTGVSLGSLASDQIEFSHLEIDGVDLALLANGDQTNYGIIMEHLEPLDSGTASEPGDDAEAPAPEAGTTKTFVIARISITNVTVTADLPLPTGETTRQTFSAPPIVLEDVGTGGDGVDLAGLVNTIVQAVLGSAADLGQLPRQIRAELEGRLEDLAGAARAGAEIESLGEQIHGTLGEVGNDAADALGGLFGGNGEDEQDK